MLERFWQRKSPRINCNTEFQFEDFVGKMVGKLLFEVTISLEYPMILRGVSDS